MEPKARLLTFVGYSNEHKAFRFLDKTTGRITISRDAKFLEDLEMDRNIRSDERKHQQDEQESNVELPSLPRSDKMPIAEEEEENLMEYESAEELFLEEDQDETIGDSEDHDSGDQRILPQRANRGVPPQRLNDYVVGKAVLAMDEPTTYEEAVTCEEKEEWIRAMTEEFQTLIDNDTWELVDPPVDRNIIGSRWVFKRKLNVDGKIDRFKARLVAQGFAQRIGVDFDDSFAPVAMHSTLRVLLTIAGYRKMQVKHLDVKAAYLYGTLEEEVFMRQPPGYAVPHKEQQVCRLKKSIYGLKQAARTWHRTITDMLLKMGFEQCKSDSCLYRKKYAGGEWMYILLYVDDILVVCKQPKYIRKVELELQTKLKITKLGNVSCFLGIRVVRDQEGFYNLSQECFIKKMANSFGLASAKGSKFPMDTGYFKNRQDSKPLPNIAEYQRLIGSLLYIATHSRPDISACVGILSRKVSSPTLVDWTEARRVVRYLLQTINYGLRLGAPGAELKLVGYCDSDWAGDSSDRKSCSGYLYRIGGATVSWVSRKQSCVATSTMEAEYIALSGAAQEAVWLRSLLDELGETQVQATTVYEDNRSCLDFVALDHQKKRSKHIDIRYHYTRDVCAAGAIDLQFCSSEEMIADILTKPLGAERVRKFVAKMGLVSIPGGSG